MVCGTGLKVIRLMLPVLGTGILFLHAASAESDAGRTLVEMRAVELPVDRQPVTAPTVDDIESSVVDEDFLRARRPPPRRTSWTKSTRRMMAILIPRASPDRSTIS